MEFYFFYFIFFFPFDQSKERRRRIEPRSFSDPCSLLSKVKVERRQSMRVSNWNAIKEERATGDDSK